jgi:hypothetical protein
MIGNDVSGWSLDGRVMLGHDGSGGYREGSAELIHGMFHVNHG